MFEKREEKETLNSEEVEIAYSLASLYGLEKT